ncbi:CBS domain-containing protein [Actinidia chinensis var. chinensis]|uniref:CBS domain-containing protein n=1 Tax=Actinidia chinensis var. chinensis TaxID=1590841 RepID=A0A2R6PTI6_ACTCC|nr:CBS domain-containing protein [Actinidia chinensis var. chinensis]
MAVRLLSYKIADLCLGKPPLRPLSASATVGDAVTALKASDDDCHISVWSRDPLLDAPENDSSGEYLCVGKVCMADVICHLSKAENLSSPSSALQSPVSVLLQSEVPGRVRHVDPSLSLLEAMDLILQGAQNLVVPIKSNSRKKLQNSLMSPTTHYRCEFCWLTQEDVIRFLLNSIGYFSPISALSIDALGVITTEFSVVGYHCLVSSAIGAISSSLAEQTSVAVVDHDGILVGEISPFTLACCDEIVTATITTLSVGDLIAYLDCGSPPKEIVRFVKTRMKEMDLKEMSEKVNFFDIPSNYYSDEEFSSLASSLPRSSRYSRSCSISARMRRAEIVVCHPESSLAAVMVQAITHRVNYVWVIEEDYSVFGMVTFSNILKVLYEHLKSMA